MALFRAAAPVTVAAIASVVLAAAVPVGCGGGGDIQFTATGVGGASTSSSNDASSSSNGGSTSASSTSTSKSASTSATTSATTSTSSGGAVPPTPISMSGMTVLESETSVAATPGGVVAVAWIAEQQSGMSTNGYRFSPDGGKTWGALQQLASPGGRVASDPVLATDAQNNFYMSWVGYQYNSQGQPIDMHVYAARAPAGQTTFGAPVEVTQGVQANDQFDKPWVTVTNKGTILVTFAKTSTGGIYSARSTDKGATWAQTVMVEDGNFRNLVYPCPPATGNRLWATYHAGGGIGLRWSDDDGASWPANSKSAAAVNGEQPAFEDPTCAVSGNEVWVAYGLSNDNNGAASSPKLFSIRIAHSADGGVTYDYHGDAHDPAAGAFFMHPQLILDGAGGLDLFYYAGNNDGDAGGAIRRSRSTNGQAWLPSVVVKQPVTYLASRTSKQWLGDYIGFYPLGSALYMSFVDNSSGTAHISFASALVP